jgi:hypothetical protein
MAVLDIWVIIKWIQKVKKWSFTCAVLSTTPRRRICIMKGQLHAFLTSALDGQEWPPSRLGRLTPEKASPEPAAYSWVRHIAGLSAVEKNISLPLPGIEPYFPSCPSRSLITTSRQTTWTGSEMSRNICRYGTRSLLTIITNENITFIQFI